MLTCLLNLYMVMLIRRVLSYLMKSQFLLLSLKNKGSSEGIFFQGRFLDLFHSYRSVSIFNRSKFKISSK